MPISVVVLGEPVRGTSIEILNGVSSTVTASNVGTGYGVYKQQLGGNLEFKSLVAGSGISIIVNDSDLTLNSISAAPAIVGNSKAVVSDSSGLLIASTTTSTQIGYLSTLTSNVQSQLDAGIAFTATKEDVITGAATTVLNVNLSASRALISNGSGKIAVSSVTSTELGYLTGVTNYIQNQFNTINAAISGFVTNPLSSTLQSGSYSFLARSGVSARYLDIGALNANGYDRYGLLLDQGTISTTSGEGYFGGGFKTGYDGVGTAETFKIKVMTIGDWNMYLGGGGSSTQIIYKPHGLTASKIRSVQAYIVDDSAINYYNLISPTDISGVTKPGIVAYDGTNIVLAVVTTNSHFDSIAFDSTSYNRGWITIIYVN